jgi:hypothetical protein
MTKIARTLLLLALIAPVPFAPAIAHHSYAMFDMQKTIKLEATVVRFKWQNPHAFIEADAKVGGRTERWAIEMTSPNNLTQSGWKRTTLRGGDKVTLHVHPLRSGAKGGSYVGVVLPDGSTMGEIG